MKKDIFIGGAWPYANYLLHVGHVAALLPGDILAKYYRSNGDNVIYVSGSDCHGTPITERAKKENKSPEEIANYYDNSFRDSFNRLGFEYDLYSKTTSPEHKKYVQEQFKTLIQNGYIYEKTENQDYCETCNQFLSDREIVGTCPHCHAECSGDQCDSCNTSLNNSEVLFKKCKTCHNETTQRPNKHLYFKLSEFTDTLQKLINNSSDTWRNNALGEAQKFLNLGLIDRAATRQLDWGVEVPVEGYEDKRIYVWIEAVLGYLSAGKTVADSRNIDFDKFMSDDNKNLVTYFVHGKDNIPFHTIIYPALVKGLEKNYRLPDCIVSSAYVNLNNEKMSKSKGNLISANELLDMFESDTIRFYLTLYGPEKNDCNCSLDQIIQSHNKYLVGGIGNFVNRNLSFVNKKFDGIIKEAEIDKTVIEYTKKSYYVTGKLIEKAEFKNALKQALEYVSFANKYYDDNQPWVKVKENIDEFNKITYTCAYMIANISNLLRPFIPNCSKTIDHMLSLDSNKWGEVLISGDINIKDLTYLYTRIDEKKTMNEDNNSRAK